MLGLGLGAYRPPKRHRRPTLRMLSLATRASVLIHSESGRSPLLKTPPRAACVALMLRHHATPLLEPVKMAAAVLSGPTTGSPAGAPGGPGGLSAAGSGPRLRLLLLESVSGLLQPRTGSHVAPVHPPIQWAPYLPGLMCLLRLHGTAGGAQVSLWLSKSPWEGW